ncbi:MAG: MBL fold metallo-hydrolase [Acidimicrobiales bacterium]
MTARRLVEVAPGVLVATSRRYATTSTVVVLGGHVLTVDPAWDPDELAALAAEAPRPHAGVATHAHHDHLLWHPALGDAPRYASAATVRLAAERRPDLLAALAFPPDLAALVGAVTPAAPGPLPWDGPEVELVEHAGHVPGHVAVWVPSKDLLLAGDMLSDVEIPLLEEGPDPVTAYAEALDRLAPYVARAGLAVPGHGSPTDAPLERLDADRRYLDSLVAGHCPDDERLALPEMLDAHAANSQWLRN